MISFLVETTNRYCEAYFRFGIECPICTELATDPITLPCEHIICNKEECLEAIKLDHTCPTCRREFPEDFALETSEETKAKSKAIFQFRRVCTDFFVESVVRFLFPSKSNEEAPEAGFRLEPGVIDLLLKIVFDKHKFFSKHDELYLETRAVVRVFLLKHLLRLPDRTQIVECFFLPFLFFSTIGYQTKNTANPN